MCSSCLVSSYFWKCDVCFPKLLGRSPSSPALSVFSSQHPFQGGRGRWRRKRKNRCWLCASCLNSAFASYSPLILVHKSHSMPRSASPQKSSIKHCKSLVVVRGLKKSHPLHLRKQSSIPCWGKKHFCQNSHVFLRSLVFWSFEACSLFPTIPSVDSLCRSFSALPSSSC